jgi:PHD/YefM family antitoxin component YafN of YafNO toxin-antitoxin module
MASEPFLEEPLRVDEPSSSQEFSAALTRTATDHRPVIVRRDGEDLAVLIPLEYLDVLREALARQEAERLASQIDWDWAVKNLPPPQEWFNADDNPFEPEEEPSR